MKREKINVPIIIGVAGHRDITPKDREKLFDTVKMYLSNLINKYSDTSFVMLNSLATGADTICAEAAIELGIEIICPLPFAEEKYEKDFSGDDLLKFKSLISRCSKKFVVDPSIQDKERGYSSAGKYIADNCNILIVVWDGIYTNLDRGTSYTVKEREASNSLRKNLVSARQVPICHIHVEKSSSNNESTFAIKYLDDKEPDFEYINTINKDCKTHNLGDGYPALENLDKNNGLFNFDKYYRMTDQLAIVHQTEYYNLCFVISFFSIILVFSYLFYDEADILSMLLIYPIALVIYYILIKVTEQLKIYKRFYYYRTLAEMLRVQIYLLASGITENVMRYVSWTRSKEISWIEDIIISIKTISNDCKQLSNDDIMRDWIENQLQYHKKSDKMKNKKILVNNTIVNIMMVLTLLLYGIILIAEYKYSSFLNNEIFNISLRAWCKILWGTFAAASLFSTNYFGKFSLERQIEDNRRMQDLYGVAKECFRDTNDNQEKRVLLENLAKEEINENIEWLSYVSSNTISFSI